MLKNIKKFMDFEKSKHVDTIYLTGVIIIVLSHLMHVFDPEHHVYFQIMFILGYLLLATQPLWKGEKMNIYHTWYKLAIVLLVIIAIVLDNIVLDRKLLHEKEIEEKKEKLDQLKTVATH